MDADTYFRRSENKILHGDWDAGLTDLNQAIALAPNNIEYLSSRANLRYERDEYRQAVEDYTTITELSSDLDELSVAQHKRAICYEHLGLYKELIGDLDWLINQGFEKVNHFTWRGVHRRGLGNLPGAVSDFTKALQISPQSDRVLLQRGSTYYELEQFEDAVKDLTQILSLPDVDPSMLEAVYHWRGSAFYRLGNQKNALADFNQVMQFRKLEILSNPSEYVGTFGLAE